MPTYVDALFARAGALRRPPGFVEVGDDPPVLESVDLRLYLFPRVALLHHPGAKWWDFVNGAREAVRARAREMARSFAAERILYVADGLGVVADGGDDDLPTIEAFLTARRGAPASWDAPPPSKAEFRERWFVDTV